MFAVHQVDGEWWASWWDPTCLDPIPPGGTFRFQFNNTNPSRWWDWTTTESANDDPYGLVADASWNHVTEPNGYGEIDSALRHFVPGIVEFRSLNRLLQT